MRARTRAPAGSILVGVGSAPYEFGRAAGAQGVRHNLGGAELVLWGDVRASLPDWFTSRFRPAMSLHDCSIGRAPPWTRRR